MNRRTRYFMTGAAALMVMGLGAGLVAYYNGGFPALSASPTGGPAELSFVPADASVVAFANVRDVMNSEFRQRMKSAMPHETDAHHDDFQQKTGINIETDIDYVVAWMGPEGNEASGLVLVRGTGTLDHARLETLATDHGGQVSEYRGKKIVVGTRMNGIHDRDDDDPDADDEEQTETTPEPRRVHQGAMAFLDQGLVAVGEESAIKRAIDAHSDGRSISGSDEMMKLVGDIETDSNVWAVGRLDALQKRQHLPEQVKNQLSSVKWFAASGRVNGGVSATLRAEARDEQAAENLRDVVRGFLALARLQAGSDQKYAGLVESFQLSGSGTTVAVSFAVPVEILDLIAPRHPRGEAPQLPHAPEPPQPPSPPQHP
jgi:Protein of unknown function (DUF3352)